MKRFSRFLFTLAVAIVALTVTVSAYDLPQKYSSDSYKTEIPEVIVPDDPVPQDGILTFVNKDLLPLESKAVEKGGTVFIPVREFFLRLGFDVSASGKKITVSNGSVTAVIKNSSKKVTVNGKEVSLTKTVRKIDGVVMAPAGIAAEVLNAKVWFDDFSQTLVISTGTFKSDNILRAINYKFWMNGEPYYEISFNKWDLLYQISAAYTNDSGWPTDADRIPAAEDALRLLHELGFRTIRVFVHSGLRSGVVNKDEETAAKYWEVMDTLFDLADKYEIQIVVCMMLPGGDFCTNGEDFFDLICNRESISRKNMYDFIDQYVTRYKDRFSVLMWEIVNEGNLECDIGWELKQNKYSLYQCGQFYADCAERIHMNDPERLVTGGDACLRPSQWHQYLGVKEGMIGVNWARDTLEDRLKAYTMLYYGLDVISVHCYNTGRGGIEYITSDEDPTTVPETFDLLMKEVRRMGKVLYNGETAVNCDNYTKEEAYEPTVKFIQEIIDSGSQLNHWWTFHTDNIHHRPKIGWQVSSGELLDAIMDGNKRLREKYVVNASAGEWTNEAWKEAPDTEVTVSLTGIDVSDLEKGCGSSFGSFAAVSVILTAAVTALRKKKEYAGK